MTVVTDKNKIEEIFSRGTVAEILPNKEGLMGRLLSGDRLRIYIGFDPTGESLHLGHAQNLIFLEDLRRLGHEVIVLFGDFTARIGDPDKASARNALSPEEVKHFVSGWVEQVKPLVSFDDPNNPAKIMFNSEWLKTLSFEDVLSLASHFTVQHMIERDMFDKRLKAGSPIYLHEFMYPLMQGYDSVAMDVDVELCATDQIFNALAGRTLLRKMKNKDKHVIALRLLANPKTGEMMSKSQGSGVLLKSTPQDMFGAIMAQPDEMTEVLLESCTRVSVDEKKSIVDLGPRDAKARVAYEIVALVFGRESADHARHSFETAFQKGGVPDEMPTVVLAFGESFADALVREGIVASKTKWRRLVSDGAVSVHEGDKIDDPDFIRRDSCVIKIGKKIFVRFENSK